MIERKHRYRLTGYVVVMISVLFCLSLRIVYLHAGSYRRQWKRMRKTRRFEKDLKIGRGKILDCNGNILALNLVKKEICADPSVVVSNNSVTAVASFIGGCIDIDPAAIIARLNRPGSRFAFLCGYGRTIENRNAETIARMNFPGVFFNDVLVRTYPRGSSMCHVLGYVNLEGEGSAGVEQRWNSYIRGVPGLVISEMDGRRRELYNRRYLEIKPRAGATIKLTLDQYVQYIVEQALDCAMEEHGARAAWAIVERVRTGEILAMANRPAYDLNCFRKSKPEQMRNRCISNIYEPGSTFKVAVVAAALNAGVVTTSQVFNCENGRWIYKGRPLRDYHPYDKLCVADIIKKSSNIGAAKIALCLGNERIYKYLKAFGIGRLTGIELPGEEAGILRPVTKWSSLTPTRIAIGHEVAVTALQMLGVVCAIANDGFLMKPYVVDQVLSADGRVLFQQNPVVMGRSVRRDTADVMKKLLVRVVEAGGTGRRASVAGYTVAGKTGTAQKVIAGGYSDVLNVASFVGFLPAEDPRLAIIVVVDEPRKSVRTGGTVAAPVFKKIAEQSVRYLDILPKAVAAQAQSDKGT